MKNPDVDAWLDAYDNPMKPVVEALREVILDADPRVSETIKWQAPTFVYKGNIASFFPRSRKHASLMFHKGADIPGDFQNLMGDGKDARSFKAATLEEVDQKSAELRAIIKAWCALQDAD
ncbi:DUF1801 domain-containing protein [Yoonia sp. SS1-5]|uniref:DUF1801 domain-containing protein n=2 Tax=Yoonia rhodophyticola TaxID=3137370 RepID=A0ABZ3JCQ0_9RHOB